MLLCQTQKLRTIDFTFHFPCTFPKVFPGDYLVNSSKVTATLAWKAVCERKRSESLISADASSWESVSLVSLQLTWWCRIAVVVEEHAFGRKPSKWFYSWLRGHHGKDGRPQLVHQQVVRFTSWYSDSHDRRRLITPQPFLSFECVFRVVKTPFLVNHGFAWVTSAISVILVFFGLLSGPKTFFFFV